jgi:thymidine kinase
MGNPKFFIFTGPMFGGKTTRLLSALDRYKYKKKTISAFKPVFDDRYGKDSINTHWGGKFEASRVSSGEELERIIDYEEPDIIAVDEAFMIPGIGESLIRLFKDGYTILVSTLQLASSGNSYMEISKILPWATDIEICPAVCISCGRDAFYTTKTGGVSEEEIEVGGADLYEPRCWKHYNKINYSS